MTPFASVAMLEKLALLKIALCSAPVCSRAFACRASMGTAAASAVLLFAVMRSGSRVVEQARTCDARGQEWEAVQHRRKDLSREAPLTPPKERAEPDASEDRKSTRLNSSHANI